MTGRLWQKLRALWGSDERLDSLESAAKAAAERAAALEAALADGQRDLRRQREGAADALAAARAALRDEIGAVASGLKALEDIVSSMELERRRRDTERHAHEAEHQAERAAHEAKTRRLDEQVGALQALRAELEQVRHRVAHHLLWETRRGAEHRSEAPVTRVGFTVALEVLPANRWASTPCARIRLQ